MKGIKVEDLINYQYIDTPLYNPSGTYLAFQVTKANLKNNNYQKEVWVVKDGVAKQMTFSFSTSIVAWLNEEELIVRRVVEGKAQVSTELFLLNMKGGEAKPFYTLPFVLGKLYVVKEYLFVATGMIQSHQADAYLVPIEKQVELLKKNQEEKDYEVIDEIPYWFNGRGFVNKKRTALFVVEPKKNQIKRITGAYENVSSVCVDDKNIYYASMTYQRKQKQYHKLYRYSLHSKKKENYYGKEEYKFSSLFLRNNQLFGFASDLKEYGVNETPNLVSIQKNKVTYILDLERSIGNHVATDVMMGSGQAFASNEKDWYVTVTDDDRVSIWKYDSKWKKTKLHCPKGAIPFLDVKKEKLAFGYIGPKAPLELYEMNLKNKKVTQLTRLNEKFFKDKYVALPQEITYESQGEKLKGWVLLPYNFNPKKTYPAVLDIHGGPRAIYSEVYMHEMQVWASQGYFVFFTNIRGSDGRDDAFADIRGQYGSVDYENLMDFTDAVLKKYTHINQKKVCVTGGSYGGFMTNWIIGHTNRFCCAASQRSIANWISKAFVSDIGLWFNADQQGAKNVFQDTQILWDHSPLKYAEHVKTPTLFIHSDEDYRCPLPEGMQMMQALAYQNIETRMVIFKGENHELSRSGKPKHRIRRLNEITNWFNQYTKKK